MCSLLKDLKGSTEMSERMETRLETKEMPDTSSDFSASSIGVWLGRLLASQILDCNGNSV